MTWTLLFERLSTTCAGRPADGTTVVGGATAGRGSAARAATGAMRHVARRTPASRRIDAPDYPPGTWVETDWRSRSSSTTPSLARAATSIGCGRSRRRCSGCPSGALLRVDGDGVRVGGRSETLRREFDLPAAVR